MAKKYVVKPNDSLWQIAKDNHETRTYNQYKYGGKLSLEDI